ncbi:hypothetical protein ACFPJ1_38880 [Kribbella qitaiheensis]|uniref:hypothetical protein n=1 Tax=Kribbella qitaiheensis TaxID=1544730 RepID=UPI003610AEF0
MTSTMSRARAELAFLRTSVVSRSEVARQAADAIESYLRDRGPSDGGSIVRVLSERSDVYLPAPAVQQALHELDRTGRVKRDGDGRYDLANPS